MGKIIVDLLSDTHNRHNHCQCEGGDIILHAGDISGHGDAKEIFPFIDWFSVQKYKHKILVPGNHDFAFEKNWDICKKYADMRGVILLNDSGVTVEGIKVWGSPVQPWFYDWAFNRQRGHDIRKHWNKIPKDTEVLITHGPPAGILDMTTFADGSPREGVGCADLMRKLSKLDVKLHVFGHIHEARGVVNHPNTTYVNAAFLDRTYFPQAKRPIRAIREVMQDGSIAYIAEE